MLSKYSAIGQIVYLIENIRENHRHNSWLCVCRWSFFTQCTITLNLVFQKEFIYSKTIWRTYYHSRHSSNARDPVTTKSSSPLSRSLPSSGRRRNIIEQGNKIRLVIEQWWRQTSKGAQRMAQLNFIQRIQENLQEGEQFTSKELGWEQQWGVQRGQDVWLSTYTFVEAGGLGACVRGGK